MNMINFLQPMKHVPNLFPIISPHIPALVLAPMHGVTDAPMRAVQGAVGCFTYSVSEFLRVSTEVIPAKSCYRLMPEICNGGRTITGLPVQLQLLGGDADRMAQSALVACNAGVQAIDINFGCPAPTVNRHDGGATLLKFPKRIQEIVAAIRDAVPPQIPVSAKLRLGWDNIEAIYENAEAAAVGGASWLTIHARTRTQGYNPPVFWEPIGKVRKSLRLPIVANGDIWSFEDFLRCQEVTGCQHFMLGRGALANPFLSDQIAQELGIRQTQTPLVQDQSPDWVGLLRRLVECTSLFEQKPEEKTLMRLKQWMRIAGQHGSFRAFDAIKRTTTLAELFERLECQPQDYR